MSGSVSLLPSVLCCFALHFDCAVAAGLRRPAPPATKAAAEKPAEKTALPPLPADAHVQQEIKLDGKTLKYTVTVGALPVRDKDGKMAGEVVTTAYTVEGENRPVTFAFNGGPGAASRLSEFRRHRPQAHDAGNEGDSPSDPSDAHRQSRAPGWTSPIWSSSIPSARDSAALRCPRTRPKSSSTPPRPTSSIFPASSTTGW